MAVNFPNSPSNGDQVTFENVTYTYNATKGVWQSTAAAANAYSRFLVSGQPQIVAGSANAVFTLVSGTGITLTSNNVTDSLTISSGNQDAYLQVANLQPQLDKYLQVANSTSFATTSSLDAYLQVANANFVAQATLDGYLQVANSTSFATTTQLDAYLQVANSTTFATTTQLDAYLQVANSTSFATTSQLDAYLQVANSASLGSGNTNLTQSDSPPGGPSVGDLWFDTSDPRLYVYYSDGSSNQWVQTNPAGSGGSSSSSASTGTIIALNYFFGG